MIMRITPDPQLKLPAIDAKRTSARTAGPAMTATRGAVPRSRASVLAHGDSHTGTRTRGTRTRGLAHGEPRTGNPARGTPHGEPRTGKTSGSSRLIARPHLVRLTAATQRTLEKEKLLSRMLSGYLQQSE